jgi:hypothetical protein
VVKRDDVRAKDFFNEIALPLFKRARTEPTKEMVWAAIVAVNQVADYIALDRYPGNRKAQSKEAGRIRRADVALDRLAAIAEALKHAKNIDRRLGDRAAFERMRDDVLSIPDYLGEPDVLAPWVIDVDGEPVTIAVALANALDHWKASL